jgi:anaerobic selenocysteine-containing dehydrogenase
VIRVGELLFESRQYALQRGVVPAAARSEPDFCTIGEMSRVETHHRACPLCEAICGLEIETEGDRVVSIRGDREDPFSQGHICPKAVALQDVHEDPDRLRHPIRRGPSGQWTRIGWTEALDEAAEGIAAVQRSHGRDAVAVYLGNPSVHNYGTMLFGAPLWRALRTRNRYSATSVDQLPHHLAAFLMFGHQLLLPVPDIDRTDFMLILGANPVVSNGSLMTAPGVRRRLEAIGERGGTVVVVDPRRTETAGRAHCHLFITPGTDALLLMALVHVVLDEGLARLAHLEKMTTSLEPVRELSAGFPPERIAAATGIRAEEIRRLAREFAGAPSAVCYGRLGVSTQEYGALCAWLVNLLNIVTGNLDRPGGAMFTRPAVDLVKLVGPGSVGRWTSRVRGLPAFGSELPCSALADEMLTPGEGRVRALLTVAGNPVLSTPNGRRLDRALADLEQMVSIDFYLNETTRHARIILPPTGPLEHDHYDLVFNLLAVRNVARMSPAVFAPDSDGLHDWQILEQLRRRLDRRSLKARLAARSSALLGPRRLVDLALRFGPWGSGVLPRGGLTVARLEANPHGLDLGALEPCLPARLRTADGRIQLAPEAIIRDAERLRKLARGEKGEDRTRGSLRLIGRRHLQSNNSWMHNAPRLMRGRERCTLLIHPRDAERLEIEDGSRVAVSTSTGRIEVTAKVSDEVMVGVVSLPHGWGHDREAGRDLQRPRRRERRRPGGRHVGAERSAGGGRGRAQVVVKGWFSSGASCLGPQGEWSEAGRPGEGLGPGDATRTAGVRKRESRQPALQRWSDPRARGRAPLSPLIRSA